MTYGELKAQFSALLNRRDNTPALSEIHCQQAIQRIQRKLRIPAMEKSIVATTGPQFDGGLTVPGDLLELIALTDVAAGRELYRTALPAVLARQKAGVGEPTIFARQTSKLLIGPLPAAGTKLRIDYFATFSALKLDADTNVLTNICPDLIVYGALSLAAAYFSDKRLTDFEARFTQIFDELEDQANFDELSGNAAVTPYLFFPED